VPARGLRILFVLDHPTFLRDFDATIRGLADRGHRIEVTYGFPTKTECDSDVLGPHGRIRVEHAPLPQRTDRCAGLATTLRVTADYVHYLTPKLDLAGFARARAGAHPLVPPLLQRAVGDREAIPAGQRAALLKMLGTLHRSLPSPPVIDAELRARGPDIVVVSPLLCKSTYQADYVQSARRLGIPSFVCVASWDNLTSKGRVRALPDAIAVWNEAQARELTELHDVPAGRIRITGAQQFDRWFGRRPATDRAAFAASVGLPDDRPYLLFVGSTNQLRASDAEASYVRAWLAALRSSEAPALRNMPVLVRPHPKTVGLWRAVELDDPNAFVWERDASFPIEEQERSAYFDGIYHSAAVVGINTSAMIEGAIVGRPVHTVCVPEFHEMQYGLTHFHYMLKERGGFLRVASSFEDHVRLLAHDLQHADGWREDQLAFAQTFLRPHGMKERAVDRLADEIESMAGTLPQGRGGPIPAPIMHALAAAEGVWRRRQAKLGTFRPDRTIAGLKRLELAVKRVEGVLRGLERHSGVLNRSRPLSRLAGRARRHVQAQRQARMPLKAQRKAHYDRQGPRERVVRKHAQAAGRRPS
jgi:hypothetical protein